MATGFTLRSFGDLRSVPEALDNPAGRAGADALRNFVTEAGRLFEETRDFLENRTGGIIRIDEAELQRFFETRIAPELSGLQQRLTGIGDGFTLTDAAAFAGDLDLGRLEDLLADLPPELTRPDATGEVPTGAATITREEAELGASLAAVPRIVRAIGPEAVTVETAGRTFQVVERYDDPVSGFDAIHLRALDGGEDVFAVDGLEVGSEPDTLSSLDLARPQVRSAEFQEFVLDARDAALAGRSLFFAGPSLGGAGAQVAAYETAEAILAAGANPGTGAIRLVTVDALGGRDAAESINGGTLDPAALSLLNALNLRTEGDIISRIGSHIGQTITFQGVDINGQPVQLSVEDAHVNIPSLLATLRSDALFAAGSRGTVQEIGGFAALSNLAAGEFVERLAASRGDNPEGDIPLQLTGTANFDAAGTRWELDADRNGAVDVAVNLSAPVADRSDLVFG